jgi:hypothetical protein
MDYQTFAEKAAVQSVEVVIAFINRAGEMRTQFGMNHGQNA